MTVLTQKLSIILLGCFFSISIISCSETDVAEREGVNADSLTYTVERATEWNALFKRSSGWFGADGIFSIPVNGREAPGSADQSISYLFFSDTMIGNPEADTVLANSHMVNNTVGVLTGDEPNSDNLKFHWIENAQGDPKSLFVPNTTHAVEGDYYWLGDGFKNMGHGEDIYLFAYRMQKTSGVFGFKEVGNVIIKIPGGSTPPFENHTQIETPFYSASTDDRGYISFGAGIFVNTEEAGAPNPDGFVYVYGLQNDQVKKLLAARVKAASFEQFDQWQFWSGDSWQSSVDSAQAITEKVSNELSVYPVADNKFALVFQENGVGNKVGMRIGKSPVGPFGPVQELWNAKEDTGVDEDFIAYNAKAHPNLSQPGELLVSYNINSFDFFKDIEDHPYLYRPRFIRVKFNQNK